MSETVVEPTLKDIDRAAQAYADTREVLTGLVADLQGLQEALSREHMPAIRKAVQRAAERHDALKALIEAAPHLFVKPKSITVHGLKVGYRKGSGKMDFEYESDDTIERLRKLLGEGAECYIAVTEKPDKEALEGLDAKTLAKVGITIADTGDRPFVKPVDGAVDKVVKAMLKEATEEVA